MKLKKLSSKIYNGIKQKYVVTYAHECNLEIARRSNLHTTPLYSKLISITNPLSKHYVLAIIDSKGNCLRPGWTSLIPFDYWINFLKTVEDITQIKDLLIIHADLEKSDAIRISRELKESAVQLGRKYKIQQILSEDTII